MKSTLNIELKNRRRMTIRGFSMLEILMAEALLSMVFACGYLITSAQAERPQSDVISACRPTTTSTSPVRPRATSTTRRAISGW